MLAVSTLSVTSASSLKPLFTSNLNQSFNSNENKEISISGDNNTNPFLPKQLSTIGGDIDIQVMITTNSKAIYVGTDKGIYKSNDAITFNNIDGKTLEKIVGIIDLLHNQILKIPFKIQKNCFKIVL